MQGQRPMLQLNPQAVHPGIGNIIAALNPVRLANVVGVGSRHHRRVTGSNPSMASPETSSDAPSSWARREWLGQAWGHRHVTDSVAHSHWLRSVRRATSNCL
eukprot:2569607-Rhodomonas_salina.3